MPITMSAAITMTPPDWAVEYAKRRGRTHRIINESLHIRLNGGDPLYCWDVENSRHVYINKMDWIRAPLAISTREACSVMNIKNWSFLKWRKILGIKPKYDYRGKPPYGEDKIVFKAYYTVDDLIEIARAMVHTHATGENDLRRMFSDNPILYMKTKNGFVPVWDSSI